MVEFVGTEITKPLPAEAVAGSTYKIEGSVKVFGAVGAPPFVYAKVRHKEWYKPEVAEEVSYQRGWPVPLSGDFSIDFKPEKEGEYRVTIVATPAPIPLPAVGVLPVLAESDLMKVTVGQKPPAVFRFSTVTIDGNKVSLTNHDADSGLLIQKKTTDYLEIMPSFEYVGPKKTARISVKAGYRDWAGGFTPRTDAYTATIELPESPDVPYKGAVKEPIKVPLTACGDISDGAIEIVAKLPDMADYITHIWNVYATKPAVVTFRFSAIIIDGRNVPLDNHDADSGLLLPKTTADSLSIIPAFEWQGSSKPATVSIKAGYTDWAGGFTPKTDAYTRSIQLPESPTLPYKGQLQTPIRVPLTAAGGITDGAIEVVLKAADMSDYITHIWNVYATRAPEEVIDFDLTRPTASPSQVTPGMTVTITCPVTSRSTKSQSATAKVLIYEGSMYPGHGALLATKTVSFSISPGQTYNAIVSDTAVAGTIDRRDIEVQIYVGGTLVKKSEWDDVYYVKEVAPPLPPKADIQNLDFIPVGGTYKIGDKVPFSLSYEYKGRAQRGQLLLSIGTGVYPSFFTVVDYSPMEIAFEEAMDWAARTLSGTFVLTAALQPGQTYNVRARLETLEDITQETDTDWGAITISAVPVGVSFQVSIWGIPDFGNYQKWCCYYWDPGISDFIGDGKWYNSYEKITFSNVQPGGYLAVFLKRDEIVSGQYTSPTFQAANGGSYVYDVQMGRIY